MGERLYILEDEVAAHIDAGGRPTDDLFEAYPIIADVLTSSEVTVAAIAVREGEVKLFVVDDEDDSHNGEDPLLGSGSNYPAGFTGYVRYGFFDEEIKFLEQTKGRRE